MNPRFTIVEIAKKLEVDKETARGLIKYLVTIGLSEIKGERKPEWGKGRAEHVYSFVDGFEQLLKMALKNAKLT